MDTHSKPHLKVYPKADASFVWAEITGNKRVR